MIAAITFLGIIKILLVLIILLAALIVATTDLLALTSLYSAQSFLIVVVTAILYIYEKNPLLLIVALMSLLTKVIIIPYIITKIQKSLKIKRDTEFHYLSPVSTIFVGALVFFIVYTSFSHLSAGPDNTFLIIASLAVSLVFMGMIIIFTRKQTITNCIGYLTMENGVLLLSIFIAELSLFIEVLIMLDLIILILLVSLLAFGIDSDMEQVHTRLNLFKRWFGDRK